MNRYAAWQSFWLVVNALLYVFGGRNWFNAVAVGFCLAEVLSEVMKTRRPRV